MLIQTIKTENGSIVMSPNLEGFEDGLLSVSISTDEGEAEIKVNLVEIAVAVASHIEFQVESKGDKNVKVFHYYEQEDE